MGDSYSFPSSHAANWFSATMVLWIYFRRTAWAMLPLATLVGISRIYNGVHYPSDVLAGAILGAGYSVAVVAMADMLWQFAGPRWFPLWRARLPSLIHPKVLATPAGTVDDAQERQAHWMRLGYLLTAVLLLVRLAYLASGRLELSEDEAYQWLWSKHLALSYYSKPPLIAYTQFIGTHIWGDNEFGVRFFSPIITAVMSVLVLRFMAPFVGARAAFVLLVVMTATPLLSLGSIVMTVDPLSVLFWTAAMIAGWHAAGSAGTTRDWLWTGLGLGCLSKPTNMFQPVCWAVFFLLYAPARAHLRKPGPWLALLVTVVLMLPVIIWNAQHGWITVAHVASDSQLAEKWHRTFTLEFLSIEAGVLNPFFFAGAIWAAVAFWRKGRGHPLELYLFSMGAPLFLTYLIISVHSRILANWIVPSVVPLFCLMAVYWTPRWQQGDALARRGLSLGLGLGLFAVVLAHDPQLVGKLIHRELPAPLDVLRRVHGWKEMGSIVETAREKLETEGTPAFVICAHYGFTSQLSFYDREAKRRVASDPIVYYLATSKPDNEFFYWPNYLSRRGQNALFVRELERPRLRPDWLAQWWNESPNIYLTNAPAPGPLPGEIQQQFQSVTDLGSKDIVANGQIVRRIQLFACHGLR